MSNFLNNLKNDERPYKASVISSIARHPIHRPLHIMSSQQFLLINIHHQYFFSVILHVYILVLIFLFFRHLWRFFFLLLLLLLLLLFLGGRGGGRVGNICWIFMSAVKQNVEKLRNWFLHVTLAKKFADCVWYVELFAFFVEFKH